MNTTMIQNPYRREFLKKKFLGKTKEERLATRVLNAKNDQERKIQVEEEELGLEKKKEVE